MSKPQISPDTISATSSQASEGGRTRLSWLAGPATGPCGPAAAPANPSAPPSSIRKQDLPMSGTCGQYSHTSFASASLQSSLASRLQAQLASRGSTLYTLTWKKRVTPLGLQICALRASVRRTSGSDSIGWPSPIANDAKGSDYSYSRGNHNSPALKLGGAAKTAAWGTPTVDEAGGTPQQFLARKARLGGACGVSLTSLNLQAQTAAWPTPTVRDHKDGASAGSAPINALLGRQVWTVRGPTAIGSCATIRTVSDGAQLNPELSRWLMGYPSAWGFCGATAMQSCRKSRQLSSKLRKE